MELNYLREFVVLAKTENFLEAAEQLFISQSTLSKHIKSMENELGVSLFHRTTRKVELSRQGLLLLPYAKQIIDLQKQYTSQLLTLQAKDHATLKIGSIPALTPYNITEALVLFKKECHDIRIEITQDGSTKLKELLFTGACELAFIRELEAADPHLVRLPYSQDTLVAVVPATHPFASRQSLPISELKNSELLFIEKNTMIYNLSYEACRRSGFEPHIAFTDHKVEHLIDFVRKGMGIALLMDKLAAYALSPDVAIITLTPTITTPISLCYAKGAKLSPAAKVFLQCVKVLTHRSPLRKRQ